MIHPTALVSSSAELHEEVQVGPYSIIGPDVHIGRGTEIGAHAVIKGPTTIGEDNRIFQFATIGEDPQDKKYDGEPTRLEIGDRNTFREYCSVHRGTAQETGVTTIGNDNLLMAYIHIAHDCVLADNIIMSNNATLAGHVIVDDYVIFSGFSGVHQFCRVGAHSFLGGFTAVTKDVPPYVIVSGQPTAVRGINSEGLKRRGFNADQLKNLKDAYRILFRSGLRLAEATEQLTELSPDKPEVQVLVDFLQKSERSILR